MLCAPCFFTYLPYPLHSPTLYILVCKWSLSEDFPYLSEDLYKCKHGPQAGDWDLVYLWSYYLQLVFQYNGLNYHITAWMPHHSTTPDCMVIHDMIRDSRRHDTTRECRNVWYGNRWYRNTWYVNTWTWYLNMIHDSPLCQILLINFQRRSGTWDN